MEAPPPNQYGSYNKEWAPGAEAGFGDSGGMGVVYLPGVTGIALELAAFTLGALI